VNPLRVLVVDDSAADAQLLLRELRKVFKVEHEHVWTPDTVRAALAKPWDIVISDWSMPGGFTGLKAFEIVREVGVDVPFIIVSGTIGEDIAVDALRAGVHDFMTKGRFARLLPSVERELREAEVRRRQRAADAEVERQRRDLERSARLLRDVLDAVPDAVMVADASGRLVLYNAAARDMLQLGTPQPTIDGWLRGIARFHSDKLTPIRDEDTALYHALHGETVDRQHQFWPNVAPKGAWFSVSARPLSDHGAIVVAHDMTHERAAQEQLMLSDRMASIGMLAAGVAHEINNPLAAVLANVDLAVGMLDELDAPGARTELAEMLHDARHAADRVRNIVRDLKLFSRHQEPETGAVELEPLLESMLRMARNEIRHRAQVVKSYAKTPRVRGSESRLGQVFLNLLINAAQAIPEGNARNNTIRVGTSVDTAGNAVIEIADTGAGMPPDVLRHLFTPFFTTKPHGVGTGLGLAISHRIVTNLGGAIQVESTVGQGTTFRVTLPPTDAAPAREASTTRPPETRRLRILVVDDEPLITTVVARALSGHDVVARTSAGDALELLRAGERFDVILCDLMMPQMTGMELYDHVVALDAAQAQRMIFMTGDAFTEVARAFVSTTTNRCIDKPFEPRQLRALIAEAVQ
jgi:signal transduction histidine kinase